MAAYKAEKQRRAQEEREADERISTAVRIVMAVNRLTMERMAATSNYERDTAILMTIDGFMLESKTYTHKASQPEADE